MYLVHPAIGVTSTKSFIIYYSFNKKIITFFHGTLVAILTCIDEIVYLNVNNLST